MRAHGCVGAPRVSPGWTLALLLAVTCVLGLSSGCAVSLGDASEADALVPRSTVASVGFDVVDEAAASTPGAVESERAIPEQNKARQQAAAVQPHVEVDIDRSARRLQVEPHASDRVTVRVTALSLGEALMFLSGGRLVPAPDLVRVLTDPLDARVEPIELGELLDQTGSSLLAVTTEASRTGQRVVVDEQLVQVDALELDASMHTGGRIHALLTDLDGRAIRDAALSLLDADGRLLAEARTDEEGHAVIEQPPPLPAPAVLGDALFVVAEVDALMTIAVVP